MFDFKLPLVPAETAIVDANLDYVHRYVISRCGRDAILGVKRVYARAAIASISLNLEPFRSYLLNPSADIINC
jgi:hypothetical protein